jgi:hypothetical protein
VDSVEEQPISREEYIQKVLSAYRQTPGTAGTIRQPDRLLAARLQQRGVPLAAVENALVLAAARRILRAPGSPPLSTIRSLAYFSAVIEELLELRVKQAYFQYLRHRIQRFTQTGRRLPQRDEVPHPNPPPAG